MGELRDSPDFASSIILGETPTALARLVAGQQMKTK
jgi:hypothetical protein